jgi:oxalate decarboxylase/phosphoglucose isomerase-like protein (cupin superfamily)
MENDGGPRYLIDPYLDFVRSEGVPVLEDFVFDLLDVEVGQWARFEAAGAYTHVKGRGDFIDAYVLEIGPGRSTAPQRHLYEQVVYVLDGNGSTSVETSAGARSFEWGAKSLFALPLNCRYRHHNTSGRSRARLAGVTSLPLVLKAFHNLDFVFDNPFEFPERSAQEHFFKGDGRFIRVRPGRHMWETNFVPDLSAFELQRWDQRGAGGSNIMFVLADGTMHAHMSEMPVGTYKKAHRHGADFHIFPVTGHGYTLLWYEGDADFVRVDWRHGSVYAPPDMMFHQHFNTSPEPARYLAVAFGGLRYPFTEDKRRTFMGMDVSVKEGGRQIEYEDQDPRINQMYLEEARAHAFDMRMDHFLAGSRHG